MFQSLSFEKKAIAIGIGVGLLAVLFLGGFYYFPTVSNQGYAPKQPIPFSHKLHAGKYKINCMYCHTYATRSRHATVPAVSVCMTCHRIVKASSPWIEKIQEHYVDQKPIKWIRVHELPDYIYFSHKTHVQGGVRCETCHGKVAEQERIVQKAPLTMGWCLECHRGKTAPPSLLKKIQKRGKHGEIAPIRCSTCHY